jgi:hypothetical protein
MQSILRKIISSTSSSCKVDDADSRGFDLADKLEGGDSHEVVADWFEPQREQALYLVRKGSSINEWTVLDYKSMKFIMRAVMQLEHEGAFTSEFDPKIVAIRGEPGRIRLALYLYPAAYESDPALVMISDSKRLNWKAFKVICDSCRYQRRRSSFTEGMEEELQERSPKSSSACSFYSQSNVDDFSGLCSVVPSSQEILRMRHQPMQVHGRDFTKISLSVPGEGADWCPVSRPSRKILEERNNHSQSHDVQIESKLPIWSEALKALALEFRHRDVLPSRRNLQLISPPSNESFCQFYRTGKSEYMLEMKRNCEGKISLVQAFCVTLSSVFWH